MIELYTNVNIELIKNVYESNESRIKAWDERGQEVYVSDRIYTSHVGFLLQELEKLQQENWKIKEERDSWERVAFKVEQEKQQLQQENKQCKKALKDSRSGLSLLLWKHGGSLSFSTREMVQFEQNDYELIRTDEPLMDGVTYSIRKIDK